MTTQPQTQEIPPKGAITLQLAPTQRLFKRDNISVCSASSQILLLWNAMKSGDPYAELYLYRLYTNLIRARSMAQREAEKCIKRAPPSIGININPMKGKSEKTYKLNFSNPYSFATASVLAKLDNHLCTLLAAKRVLYMTAKEYRQKQKKIISDFRTTLAIPYTWKETGVTRDDIKNNTSKAQLAIEIMEPLPEKILTMEVRAPFLLHCNNS